MTSLKNLRHGRIRLISGDTLPLTKFTVFTEGDFSYTENFPVNVVRDRGKVRETTKGDEQPVDWSFSAKFVDKTIIRTLRDKVWDGQAEAVVGLTGGAVNSNVELDYAYEQESFQFATGETGTKIANGVAPSSDDEFSEEVGAEDIEGVVKVEKGDGTASSGGFNVQQPAADVDRDVTYDAVGESTLGDDPDCAGGVKTLKVVLDIFDPCDPPDPDDPTAGTVLESYELDDAYLTSLTYSEGDENNVVAFVGQALIDKVNIVTVPAP